MTSIKSPWNKGRSVGQRLAFTPDEIRAIGDVLTAAENLHDLCLYGRVYW